MRYEVRIYRGRVHDERVGGFNSDAWQPVGTFAEEYIRTHSNWRLWRTLGVDVRGQLTGDQDKEGFYSLDPIKPIDIRWSPAAKGRKRNVFVLSFWEKLHSSIAFLSFVFARSLGTFSTCRYCQKPFLRSLGDLQSQTCPRCANWERGPRLQKELTRLSWRLQKDKRLSKIQRGQKLKEAQNDFRVRRMPLSKWLQKWGRDTKVGRPVSS